VEFTSEAASFLFLGSYEAAAKLETFTFNLFAFGHIEDHAYHANRLGCVIVIATSASIEGASGAVRSMGTALGLVWQSMLERIPPGPRNPLDVVRM
jgi:hypothetical protein